MGYAAVSPRKDATPAVIARPQAVAIQRFCWLAANPSLHSGPPLRGVLRPSGWCPAATGLLINWIASPLRGSQRRTPRRHREAAGRGDPEGFVGLQPIPPMREHPLHIPCPCHPTPLPFHFCSPRNLAAVDHGQAYGGGCVQPWTQERMGVKICAHVYTHGDRYASHTNRPTR